MLLSQIYNSIIILCGCNHKKFIIINDYKHDSWSYSVKRRKGCNSKILIVIHDHWKRKRAFHSNSALKGGIFKHRDCLFSKIPPSFKQNALKKARTQNLDTIQLIPPTVNTNTLQTHHAQTEALPWFQRTVYSYNLLYHSYRPKRNISRIYNSIPKHLTSFSSIHGKTRVPLVHKPVKAWRGNGRTQQKN